MNYQKHKKLTKFSNILSELDKEQAILDLCAPHAAEDLRWCRIYLSKALAAINTSKAFDK